MKRQQKSFEISSVFAGVTSVLVILYCVANFFGVLHFGPRKMFSVTLGFHALLFINFFHRMGSRGPLAQSIDDALKTYYEAQEIDFVFGHDRIHEAERVAIDESSNEIMLSNFSFKPRCSRLSEGFLGLARTLKRKSKNSDVSIKSAVAFSGEADWGALDSLTRSLVGRANAEVRLYQTNPVRADFLITEKVAIISLPVSTNNKELALRFRNPEMIRKLHTHFLEHIWKDDGAGQTVIGTKAELDSVRPSSSPAPAA